MGVNSKTFKTENYPAIFRRYVIRSSEYILERLQQLLSSLPNDDRELALHTLTFTLKLSEAWPLTRQIVLIMAPKMEQAGERDSWLVYLEGALEQSQQLGDVETEAELRFHLGVLYQQLAQFDNARRHFQSSAAYFEKVGPQHNQARALNRLAYVARLQGQFEEARQLVEVVLGLLSETKTEQAYCYLVLGTIAYDQREWQNAKNFFSKSLTLWEETKDQRMIAWGLTNLGTTYWALQKYEEAILCYEKSIKFFEECNDSVHQAVARMDLGNVYQALGRSSEALNLYSLAEAIFYQTKDRLHMAMVHTNRGIALQNLQQLDKAKQAYLFSIEQWQKLGNISMVLNVMDGLGLVHLEQGLYDQAIATFQDALNQLAHIKNQPSYEYLFTEINIHLRTAIEHSRKRETLK